MLPADWGEAYLFKANGTAKGYEMDDNGNLKETWDNIWAIKEDKLYITEDYDDDPYDKPETSVLEIINITSSKAVYTMPQTTRRSSAPKFRFSPGNNPGNKIREVKKYKIGNKRGLLPILYSYFLRYYD